MIPSEDEGDIPSSPGYLLLTSEESSTESDIQDVADTDPPGAIEPALRTCECKVYARSPILLASRTLPQEIMGTYQVDPAPR